MEGNYRQFALFYFVFESNFRVQAPPPPGGAYIWRGDLTEGVLRYSLGGLVFGGVLCSNAWRSLHHHIQICKGKCM